MAVDYFLDLDGIKGESLDGIRQKHIRLLSWSWGANALSSISGTSGSGAGKVNLDEFSFITEFDRASPKFFKSICTGTHILKGTMTAVKAGALLGMPYLTMDFKSVFITGIEQNASWEIPAVNVAFSFEEVTVEYRVQKADGSLTSTGPITYNQKENKLS
jgi:type VI secretion system secreted protein Hcp